MILILEAGMIKLTLSDNQQILILCAFTSAVVGLLFAIRWEIKNRRNDSGPLTETRTRTKVLMVFIIAAFFAALAIFLGSLMGENHNEIRF